jgi:hypothetical protein
MMGEWASLYVTGAASLRTRCSRNGPSKRHNNGEISSGALRRPAHLVHYL